VVGKESVARVQTPPPPAEIVHGIKLTVSGRELGVRLTDRIRWHRERGDALVTQMKRLEDVERDAGDDLANVLGRYDSPRVALDKKLREHQERASFLAFVRDHIVAEQIYKLDSTDLRMTEILPDKPW
jgi:hypothetical protein